MDALTTNFPHRRNEEGAYESICRSCFATVATAQNEAWLRIYEQAHICDPLWASRPSEVHSPKVEEAVRGSDASWRPANAPGSP
jgi:hypothetical protein